MSRPRGQSGARRGVAVIVSGTLVAQLLVLAAYPILTRVFTAAEFGAYALVYAVANLFFPLAALRVDALVPLPRSEDEAIDLVGFGLRAAAGVGLLGTAVVLLVQAWLFGGGEGSWRWLWAAVPLTALVAAFQVVNAWAIRRGRFGAIARRSVLQAAVMVSIQVAAGLGGAVAGGLLAGLSVAFVVSIVALVVGSGLPREVLTLRRGDLHGRAGAAASLSLAGVLNGAGLQAPVLLVSAFFGLGAAGQFALAQQAIAVPAALVGQAVSQVFLSRLSAHVRETGESGRTIFLAATRPLLLLAVPAGLAALLLAPAVFPIVFGDAWRVSGEMVAALSVSLAAQLVGAPLSQTLIVAGAARTQLAWDASRVVAVVASLVLADLAGASATGAVWCYSLVNAASYVVGWVLAYRASSRTG
ncbi:lipopolysaccharide biosynthesis protein [Nocardioides pinisoli]|uniref:Oligosaccharide flippase family protein n=1 Tax=Nocardioides pinisoli TaxID=2950279 RepID=A0ABT1KTL4_9ACTN|nr:oligosaccharide flippase family protein [Nocardioides pinisoli]MCP3420656.1 oligosaccharide flippase family protein [Nocardioides pinisoli]